MLVRMQRNKEKNAKRTTMRGIWAQEAYAQTVWQLRSFNMSSWPISIDATERDRTRMNNVSKNLVTFDENLRINLANFYHPISTPE